jgi:uncharacterized protein
MHQRTAELIAALGLEPHPEGGHFREVYRSRSRVQPMDDRFDRTALTVIYFLLGAGEVSRWHRVASDEAWHFCEGAPLELLEADAEFRHVSREMLGPLGDGARPVRVIPAGSWQAARSTGAYTLVDCTVGPGFEFKDFQLLGDEPGEAARLRERHPELTAFL